MRRLWLRSSQSWRIGLSYTLTLIATFSSAGFAEFVFFIQMKQTTNEGELNWYWSWFFPHLLKCKIVVPLGVCWCLISHKKRDRNLKTRVILRKKSRWTFTLNAMEELKDYKINENFMFHVVSVKWWWKNDIWERFP